VKIALDEHNNQQNMQLTNTFSSSIKKNEEHYSIYIN